MRDFRSASLESLAREAPVRFHCLLAAATRAAGEARDGGVTRPLSYLEWRFCTHRSTDPFPFQLCRATLLVQRGQSSALRPPMCASYGSSAGDLNSILNRHALPTTIQWQSAGVASKSAEARIPLPIRAAAPSGARVVIAVAIAVIVITYHHHRVHVCRLDRRCVYWHCGDARTANNTDCYGSSRCHYDRSHRVSPSLGACVEPRNP